jgi:hypothetical protein
MTDLEALAIERGIPRAEIEAALAALSAPDPAGLLGPATRDGVLQVALHMNPSAGRFAYHSPHWMRIVRGEPAAHAIYYHELKELEALTAMGVGSREEIDPRGPEFQAAHALACWAEAGYWEQWANAEGRRITATAFLYSHPRRSKHEIAAVRDRLVEAGIAVHAPSAADR